MAISRRGRQHLYWLVLLISCLAFTLYTFLGDGGYLKLQEHRVRLEELHLENARLREARMDLEGRIQKLETDPRELERIAREQYNLARPGDIIVTVPENSTPSRSAAGSDAAPPPGNR